MNLDWIRPFVNKSKRFIVQNAPHILMGVGTCSSLTGIWMAARAALPAHEAVVQAKMDKGNDILDGFREGAVTQNADGSYEMPDLTAVETVKAAGKFYVPVIGVELLSLLCFWTAHGIDMKRQAILAGLYSTAVEALTEYQKKVVDMIGEKPEKEIRKAVAQDHIDENPPPRGILAPDMDYWCRYKGYWFRASYHKLKKWENEANKELVHNMYLSEAELLDMFDPDHIWVVPSDESRNVGWSIDRLMEFDILPTFTAQNEPALELTILDSDGRPYMPWPGYSKSL